MSHQDKNELSKEELAAKGVEGDEMSLLANVGIFVAIAGTAVFVAIAGIVVWNFMADALTREISGKTTQRKASMLEDGKVSALVALAKHKALHGDSASFKVNAGKLAMAKVKGCEPGSAVLCNTVLYRRNQKLLVLQGGKTAKGVTVLPIATGMKRLLAKPGYLNAVSDVKPKPRKAAPAPRRAAPKKPAVRKPDVRKPAPVRAVPKPTTRPAVKKTNTKKAAPTTRPAGR